MGHAPLPTLSSFVIMRITAAVGAALLIIAGLVTGALYAITLTTASIDAPSHLWFLFTPWWQETVRLHLSVWTPVFLVGGLILSLLRPLFYQPLHQLEHDTMLRDIEAMLPFAVEQVLKKTYANYAEVLWFSRLVSDLKREAPKLRQETSEMIAVLALSIAEQVNPLIEESDQLLGLIEAREREAKAAERAITDARHQLSSLTLRVRQVTDGRSMQTVELGDLMRHLGELQATLAPYLAGNVVPLRQAE